MSVPNSPSLRSTLKLALAQSDALHRQLADRDSTIEQLKRENENLRKQIRELKDQDQQANLAAHFNEYFRKDAEKQAEIDSLKKQLARSKLAQEQLQTPSTSASTSMIAEKQAPDVVPSEQPEAYTGDRHRPLQEITPNCAPSIPSSKRRKLKRQQYDHGAGGIPDIAEDGATYNSDELVDQGEPAIVINSSPNRRLENLLAAPSPVPTKPLRRVSPRHSHGSNRAPEDDEPLRCRPIHRLNITHFKVNPKYTDGEAYAFQEVVRNKEARRCLPGCMKECCASTFKALAKTLPPDPNMNEDELLLGFLGPGSEERIAKLTPLARTNLLHEARAKQLADTYGKMHRTTFEIPSSPPAFWMVELPGTQEQQQLRDQAKEKERKEIESRYREAMKGGCWLFADE
jgi:hypothetical protein